MNKRKSRKRDISIIAENKPNAHHKTQLHAMKVYNARPVSLTLTIEVLLIKILLYFEHWSNQRFQAIEFVDLPVPEKLDMFRINISQAFNAWLSSRRNSYLQVPRTPLRTLGTTWDHDYRF